MSEIGSEIRAVALERMRYAIDGAVSLECLEQSAIGVEATVDLLCGQLRTQLDWIVAGEELEHIKAEWPRDWWQAFRARWFPAWALKRWPVVMAWAEMRADAVYPKISLPDKWPLVIPQFNGQVRGTAWPYGRPPA